MDKLVERYTHVINNMKGDLKNDAELQRYINIAQKKLEELKEKNLKKMKSKESPGMSDIMLEFYEDFLDGLQEDAVMKKHMDKKKVFFSEKYSSGSHIKNSELENELKRERATNADNVKTINNLLGNLKNANEIIDTCEKKLDEQKVALKQQRNKIDELGKTIDVRNMENDRLRDGISKRNDTIVKQEKDIYALNERVDTCERKLDEQKVALQQQRNKIDELDQNIAVKEMENSKLKDGINKRNDKIVKQERDIYTLKSQKPFMKKNTAIWISTIFSYFFLLIIGYAIIEEDMIICNLLANVSAVFVLTALALKSGKGRTAMLVLGELLKAFNFGLICVACNYGQSNITVFLILLAYLGAFIVECYICKCKEILFEEKNNYFIMSEGKTGIRKTIIGLVVLLAFSWIAGWQIIFY